MALKCFHFIKAIRQAVSEITREERIELEEMEIFAKEFKRKRINFGESEQNLSFGIQKEQKSFFIV